MKKLGVAATAAVMALTAVTATFGTTAAAEAGHRHRGDIVAGAALGIIGGVLLGQALAPRPGYAYAPPAYYAPRYYQPRRVYRQPRVVYQNVDPRSAHVAWCSNRYRSYSPYDNTWVSYSGYVRQCVSPYSY